SRLREQPYQLLRRRLQHAEQRRAERFLRRRLGECYDGLWLEHLALEDSAFDPELLGFGLRPLGDDLGNGDRVLVTEHQCRLAVEPALRRLIRRIGERTLGQSILGDFALASRTA